MCNLYTVRKSAAEVAAHFGVASPVESNAGDEVYPGYPGVVVREKAGERVMQSMAWGFPLRLKGMKPDSKLKPVNNIADLRKNMWIGLARKPQWRCLIPFIGFAETESAKGAKTRIWFNGRLEDLLALQARTFATDLIEITRTGDLWNKPRGAAAVESPALF